jgi:hypothetical protein
MKLLRGEWGEKVLVNKFMAFIVAGILQTVSLLFGHKVFELHLIKMIYTSLVTASQSVKVLFS